MRLTEKTRLDILNFSGEYETNEMQAKDIVQLTGIKVHTVRSVLDKAGVKKSDSKRNRMNAYIWFYENRIYSAKQIAKLTSTTTGTVRNYFTVTGAKKKNITEAVNDFMTEGLSFDRALSLINKTSGSYYRSMMRLEKIKND